jgi:hypothetical protein
MVAFLLRLFLVLGAVITGNSNGPLITLITQIMDMRNQRTARACGVAAR